ncbi:MAG: UbiA family prenyltransferase [Methanobacteriota archaeon]|nr:MAG: UbiA family prenyltransferase [Euryarchaeota archaeon]
MASGGDPSVLKGYVAMARLGNCAMAAAAVLLSAVICSQPQTVIDRFADVLTSMAVVVAFMAGGNSLNDYFDRETDKTAHPSRPIPKGIVTPRGALVASTAMFGVSFVLGWIVGFWSLAVVLGSAAVMLAYEIFLKSEGLAGNLAISWLTAALFLFGGLAVDELQLAWILAALAFFATLGREIVKDIQDIKGDVGTRKTLPIRIGPGNAGVVASAMLAIAVLLSPAPFLLSLVSVWYMPLVAVADTVFIYSAMIHFADPEQGQKVIKLAMLIALTAFLFGGVT